MIYKTAIGQSISSHYWHHSPYSIERIAWQLPSHFHQASSNAQQYGKVIGLSKYSGGNTGIRHAGHVLKTIAVQLTNRRHINTLGPNRQFAYLSRNNETIIIAPL